MSGVKPYCANQNESFTTVEGIAGRRQSAGVTASCLRIYGSSTFHRHAVGGIGMPLRNSR